MLPSWKQSLLVEATQMENVIYLKQIVFAWITLTYSPKTPGMSNDLFYLAMLCKWPEVPRAEMVEGGWPIRRLAEWWFFYAYTHLFFLTSDALLSSPFSTGEFLHISILGILSQIWAIECILDRNPK